MWQLADMFQNQNTNNNNNEAVGVVAAMPLEGATEHQQQQQQQNINYNGVQPPAQNKGVRKKPYVKITEQPASKALRFRYECEGRSAGSIPGVNSTPENKTYPTIEIVGYKGRAVVVVSCVTKDQPYRPHPHNLVGKEGCKKGVCTLEINSETMRAVFSNLGIQCVKKKDIESALKAREDIRVDPFKTGFAHRNNNASIDLNVVRLCFQVFMESEQKGRFTQPLPPVVSDPIYDKKAMSDLVICRLCTCSATVLGNTQIILLCEKVAKDDISVRFWEEKNNQVVWEALGEFQNTDVHKQTAIAFKTPRYHKLDITEPAKVFIQLRRPSDGVTSEALPFEYIPLDSDPAHLKRKRQRTGGDAVQFLLQQTNEQRDIHLNVPIKTEPRDTSPQPYAAYRNYPEMSPSPQSVSQSPSYNFNQTLNANYNIGTQHLLSPNNQAYNMQRVGFNNTPSPMHVNDFEMFVQQPIGQQQPQQQQQYNNNSFMGNNFNAGATTNTTTTWQEALDVVSQNPTMNLMNIGGQAQQQQQQQHQLQQQQQQPGDMTQHWNVAPMHAQSRQQQHQQQQQQQHLQQQVNLQQYTQQQGNNNLISMDVINTTIPTASIGATTIAVNNIAADANAPTISNLLSLDSEQLMRINSDELQQISCLSIST